MFKTLVNQNFNFDIQVKDDALDIVGFGNGVFHVIKNKLFER